MKHRGVTVELVDTAVDVRLAGQHAGVVHQVPCREIVAAVDDDVVILDDLHDVVGHEAGFMEDHVAVGVQVVDRLLGGHHLGTADVGRAVDDLPLQVRHVHHVEVDKPDSAHSGGREVVGRRGSQSARSHQQHPGVEDLHLALLPDLGHDQVAGIPKAFFLAQVPLLDRGKTGCAPSRISFPHGDDIGVSHGFQRLRRQRRAIAARAVQHDFPVPVALGVFNPELEKSPSEYGSLRR